MCIFSTEGKVFLKKFVGRSIIYFCFKEMCFNSRFSVKKTVLKYYKVKNFLQFTKNRW